MGLGLGWAEACMGGGLWGQPPLCSLLLPLGLLLGDSQMEITLLCFLGTFVPPGRLRQGGAGVRDVVGRVGTPGIMQVSKEGLSQSHLHVEIRRGCFAFSAGGTAGTNRSEWSVDP